MSRTLRFQKSADKIKNGLKPYRRWKLSSLRDRYEKALRVDEWYIETPFRNELRSQRGVGSKDRMQTS
ncbi:MAG: hypothetical protein UY35_C0003G0041 [Candidatus Saccharibacteria bacterium GW2011_GWC2_48_9]|nr:MAG: hypothetical protein UY35_C0003G0041 [Candidatus Saccharibacteria bacterium GW2011_GWC2_48_9]HCH34129.1 hypothetical protein [Candidatus Saccharibacteria bacterium]